MIIVRRLASAAALALVMSAPATAAEDLTPDLAAGEERYRVNCVNCHGRTGRGMAAFPSVAGHDADYIADRLHSYRAREMVGPNSALMFSLADALTDQEIANLAAFIADSFP